MVSLRREDGPAALRNTVDPAHLEAVCAEQHLLSRLQVGPHQQQNQFVGTIAADDPFGVQPMHFADGLAQRRLGAVRIAVQLPRRLPIGLQRRRAWPQRGFVGGQLDRRRHPRNLAPPLLVGRQFGNARHRNRAAGRFHERSAICMPPHWFSQTCYTGSMAVRGCLSAGVGLIRSAGVTLGSAPGGRLSLPISVVVPPFRPR